MILEIELHHTFLGGHSKEVLYVGPDELEAGADLASHFREEERESLSPFTAAFVDDNTIEITCRDKSCRYTAGEESTFETPTVSLKRPSANIEGNSYDNDHELYACVNIMANIQPTWDELKVIREGETAVFSRESLTPGEELVVVEDVSGKRNKWLRNLKVSRTELTGLKLVYESVTPWDYWPVNLDCSGPTEHEHGGFTFSLISHSAIVNEWDMMENKPVRIRVPKQYLKEAATDAEAAYLLAECVQEQYPESLEVIADYMRAACELGSYDAEEWLKDYLSDDGRYDAYC